MIQKFYFSTREVIEIQSSIYYKITDNLGFNSLANTIKEYADACYNLISRILAIANQKKVEILELGPGTLFFANNFLELIRNSGLEVQYTVVDVNDQLEPSCQKLGINFINSSFHQFAITNKKRFDFLFMNQALDMWAGENYVYSSNTNNKYKVFWKLFDTESKRFISEQELQKYYLNEFNGLFWIKFYQASKRVISSLHHQQYGLEKILLPYSFFGLIQKIRLGGFIQDYWNIDKETSLRTGLSATDCSSLLTKFPLNKQSDTIERYLNIIKKNSSLLSIVKFQNISLMNWFTSNIIPFGTRDVTYSPEISRVVSLVEKSFNYEIFTLKRFVSKLVSQEAGDLIDENQFGSEKNFLFFERKFLKGR